MESFDHISSDDFRVLINTRSGAIWEITDPKAHNAMNWISSPSNSPWQPSGSRWGLGFADLGSSSLHRTHWSNPKITSSQTSSQAVYTHGPLELTVNRELTNSGQVLLETYSFLNQSDSTLNLGEWDGRALGIYTPFNDHYTNTEDSLKSRAHAHIWANGGSSGWVRLAQMGGNGRNLGLVLTKGALNGYSVESRDTITSSNTRGVFLLHPAIKLIQPRQTAVIQWAMFWHHDWDDFFGQCMAQSNQFIHFTIPSYTLTPNETIDIILKGASINSATTVNGKAVCHDDVNGQFTYPVSSDQIGHKTLTISTVLTGETLTSTIFLNSVPSYNDIMAARVKFITEKQQITDANSPIFNAYVPYDNQMQGRVIFDPYADRNSGRERVGMGVFIGRWLKENPNDAILSSLIKYYEFVCTKLQDKDGFVLNGPGDRDKRLYNWPWVMQLHLVLAALNPVLPPSLADKTPLDRFKLTMNNFYQENGQELYPIGLPILEGLRTLKAAGDDAAFQRALSLFENHGQKILQRGVNYPPFEVNFEQSIVAPAATILLELYRWTKEPKWLEGADIQLEVLLRFGGRQPDYRLHHVGIRHWDGYWFGKDRMWGDTFPHYWSTITALALHHKSKASDDSVAEKRADSIIRSNFALFSADGSASCAWIYPRSVNGRDGHYADPYANDQDWALAHLLQIADDNKHKG